MDDPRASPDHADTQTRALLVSVFTIGTCGLIYELLAGTIASYLLGDSVTQFSTIIGVYLFSMGVGSYLSRYFRRDLITWFIEIEILVGLIGGISSPVLFFAFAEIGAFRLVLYGWVTATGVLVGLEIPFLIRILEDQLPLRDLVSKVLSLDCLGALAASLLFPLWLVPRVGLMRSSFVFGMLNVLVAVWACHLFRRDQRRPWLTAQAYGALVLLLAGLAFSDDLMEWSERRLYEDPVILSGSPPRLACRGRPRGRSRSRSSIKIDRQASLLYPHDDQDTEISSLRISIHCASQDREDAHHDPGPDHGARRPFMGYARRGHRVLHARR